MHGKRVNDEAIGLIGRRLMIHRRINPITVQLWFIAVVVTLASAAECRAGGRVGVVAGGGAGGDGAAGARRRRKRSSATSTASPSMTARRSSTSPTWTTAASG